MSLTLIHECPHLPQTLLIDSPSDIISPVGCILQYNWVSIKRFFLKSGFARKVRGILRNSASSGRPQRVRWHPYIQEIRRNRYRWSDLVPTRQLNPDPHLFGDFEFKDDGRIPSILDILDTSQYGVLRMNRRIVLLLCIWYWRTGLSWRWPVFFRSVSDGWISSQWIQCSIDLWSGDFYQWKCNRLWPLLWNHWRFLESWWTHSSS